MSLFYKHCLSHEPTMRVQGADPVTDIIRPILLYGRRQTSGSGRVRVLLRAD
jgi:hypothetical protein